MRKFTLLVIVAAVLGGATTSASPEAVPGKLVGTWTYDFNSITIKNNGRALFRLGAERIFGTVSGTATRVTFGPLPACVGKGVYAWKLKGRELRFRPIRDTCAIRRIFLRPTWTRK